MRSEGRPPRVHRTRGRKAPRRVPEAASQASGAGILSAEIRETSLGIASTQNDFCDRNYIFEPASRCGKFPPPRRRHRTHPNRKCVATRNVGTRSVWRQEMCRNKNCVGTKEMCRDGRLARPASAASACSPACTAEVKTPPAQPALSEVKASARATVEERAFRPASATLKRKGL